MRIETLKCDWVEDFSHENGNYFNICCECSIEFKGHKRRVVCKECATERKETFESIDKTISNFLVSNYGFQEIHKFKRFDEPEKFGTDKAELDDFDCILRIHEMHYLAYSNHLKYFSIGVKFSEPKGKAGGGYKQWNWIMLPKCIYSIEQAKVLMDFFLDESTPKNLYIQ